MDQLICASLSRTHCWYEVGMLKVQGFAICCDDHTVLCLYMSCRVYVTKSNRTGI